MADQSTGAKTITYNFDQINSREGPVAIGPDSRAITNYDIEHAEFNVPREVWQQLLRAGDLTLPEDLSVAELKTVHWEPDTVFVPAGSFMMGSNPGPGISPRETSQFEVTLPAYRIGYRPVTNAEYYFYLQQTGQIAQTPPELGWEKVSSPSADLEGQPVCGMTWYEALAYCSWLSTVTRRAYTLPNEAQWERVAHETGDPLQMVGHIREWTTTLWGEKRRMPDERYRYPWKSEDGRENIKINKMVRRVTRGVCATTETSTRPTQRASELPYNRGWRGNRIGFRVVINLEE